MSIKVLSAKFGFTPPPAARKAPKTRKNCTSEKTILKTDTFSAGGGGRNSSLSKVLRYLIMNFKGEGAMGGDAILRLWIKRVYGHLRGSVAFCLSLSKVLRYLIMNFKGEGAIADAIVEAEVPSA